MNLHCELGAGLKFSAITGRHSVNCTDGKSPFACYIQWMPSTSCEVTVRSVSSFKRRLTFLSLFGHFGNKATNAF